MCIAMYIASCAIFFCEQTVWCLYMCKLTYKVCDVIDVKFTQVFKIANF